MKYEKAGIFKKVELTKQNIIKLKIIQSKRLFDEAIKKAKYE